MSDRSYGLVELVGSSGDSVEAAIENAIATAAESHENLNWFEVVEVRGHIEGTKVGHYQVTVKVGYRLGE